VEMTGVSIQEHAVLTKSAAKASSLDSKLTPGFAVVGVVLRRRKVIGVNVVVVKVVVCVTNTVVEIDVEVAVVVVVFLTGYLEEQ
jgi:hypothetical protein